MLTIWVEEKAGRLDRVELRRAAWIGDGEVHADPQRPPHRRGAALIASRVTGAAGVLLHADAAAGEVRVNGVRPWPGLCLLRHADRVQVGATVLWVSGQRAPRQEVFAPPADGGARYCERTKARLQPGDHVVLCPGTLESECGRLYRADAWNTGLACHRCGFDQAAPPWRPPSQRLATLPELLERVADGSIKG